MDQNEGEFELFAHNMPQFLSKFEIRNEDKDNIWRMKDGKFIRISDMTPDHLDNSVNFLQTKLAGVDAEISSLALSIAEAPHTAESVIVKFAEAVDEQVRLESKIAVLQSETKRRSEFLDKKMSVRKSVIDGDGDGLLV